MTIIHVRIIAAVVVAGCAYTVASVGHPWQGAIMIAWYLLMLLYYTMPDRR